MEAASAGSHRHAGVAAEARRKSSNGGRDELNVHPDAKMGSGHDFDFGADQVRTK